MAKKSVSRKTVQNRRIAASSNAGSPTDASVDLFMKDLDHPKKKDVEAVRRIILGVSPRISEGIKWNAPSFRTTDYFATVNLRGKGGDARVWLILHFGAKVKDNVKTLKIADPKGLLKWLAKDRCLVTFADGKDVLAKRSALKAIIREWIEHV